RLLNFSRFQGHMYGFPQIIPNNVNVPRYDAKTMDLVKDAVQRKSNLNFMVTNLSVPVPVPPVLDPCSSLISITPAITVSMTVVNRNLPLNYVEEAKDGTPNVVRQESPEPIKEEEKPTRVSATIKTKVVLEKDVNFMKCLFFYNVDFML
ncbi:hypothetical protein Tco_0393705, partial [Tanacetum coccineum]